MLWARPVPCRMLGSIPDLLTSTYCMPGADCPSVTTKSVSSHCQMSLGGRNHLAENHCAKPSAGLIQHASAVPCDPQACRPLAWRRLTATHNGLPPARSTSLFTRCLQDWPTLTESRVNGKAWARPKSKDNFTHFWVSV